MKKGKAKGGRFCFFSDSCLRPIHGRLRPIGRIFAFVERFFAGSLGCLPGHIKNRSEFKELKYRFALVSPGRNAMNNEAKTQPAPRPLRLFRLCGARLRAGFQRPAPHPATGASRSGSRPPSVKKRHWPSRSTRHAPQPWSSKPSKPTASGMGVPLSS